MAKEIVQADLGRIRALLDEVLGHSDYSDVQRMGGLTNRTYCVTFADGAASWCASPARARRNSSTAPTRR